MNHDDGFLPPEKAPDPLRQIVQGVLVLAEDHKLPTVPAASNISGAS